MSKASGLLLILAGVGLAAYALYGDPDHDSVAAEGVAKSEHAKPAANTAISLAALPEPKHAAAAEKPPVPPKPQPAVRPSPPPAPAAAQPSPNLSGPVVVTLAHRPSDPPARPAPAFQPHRAAAMPGDRVTLARDLQRELKRVGCYEGEVNGVWTPTTRKAMKAFTERVNATLPVDEPDYILLALVQGHQDKACGKSCPSGQALADDGRCLPAAIIAHAAKKAQPQPAVAAAPKPLLEPGERQVPAITGWSTTAAVLPNPPLPPGEGRMALAGPKADVPDGELAQPQDKHAATPRVPLPAAAIYDRRPPPPRQVQRRAPTSARAIFRSMGIF